MLIKKIDQKWETVIKGLLLKEFLQAFGIEPKVIQHLSQ